MDNKSADQLLEGGHYNRLYELVTSASYKQAQLVEDPSGEDYKTNLILAYLGLLQQTATMLDPLDLPAVSLCVSRQKELLSRLWQVAQLQKAVKGYQELDELVGELAQLGLPTPTAEAALNTIQNNIVVLIRELTIAQGAYPP